MRRAGAVAAALGLALAAGFATASADGEVGLVIQIGSEVETHCVAYSGDSISGEQTLKSAGFTVEQLGSGNRAVCAIDDVGCFDSSSFSSCFCECRGRDCTYWAFFTREYGAGWVYSTMGFNLLQATDGDVHGWKWGAGGPSSAPAPVDVTFEQICGHTPQSLNPPTATPTSPPPAATATAASGASPTMGASPTAGVNQTPETPTGTPGATVWTTPGTTATSATAAPSVVVTIGNTPAPPSTADPGDEDSGGNGGLIAAGLIGVGLLAAIGGAAIWRQRHGA